MNELPNWVNSILALAGGLLGAWVGVKIAITRLEGRVDALSDKYVILRSDFDALRTSYMQYTAERSGYIQRIRDNAELIEELSTKLELTRGDIQAVKNIVTPYSMILQILCEKAGIPWKDK